LSPRTNNRPILGVDLDNVLALTDPLIRRLINEMFRVQLEQRDIVYFEYSRCGITQEQEERLFQRFHDKECENVQPIQEALDTLVYFASRFEIHVITGRPPETKTLTQNWLSRYEVPCDNLDFLKSKNGSAVSFALFIDDNRQTAYAMAHKGVHAILLNYPWNQPDHLDPPNLFRAQCWSDIKRHVEEHLL